MRHVHVLTFTVVLLGLVACGGHNGNGPCVGANPDPSCALECDGANPCPDGFYCAADGTCNAECTPDGLGCADTEHCSPDGRCEPNLDADCPNVTLNGTRTTPTVQLLLDQSGSMTAAFGNTNRYDAMTDALVGPSGVVTTTQGSVIFGAALYTGTAATCPQTTTVARSLNNLQSITDLLQNNAPASDTPTGESIDVIVNDFAANPPPADSPSIIILATDGEPDTCAEPNPQNGQPEAIAAAQRAYAMGIRLYILGVSSDVGLPHLQDMANAGVGNDPAASGQDAPFFQADNPTELAQQLEQIVGGVLSCELVLDGVIDTSQASSGVVTLNGQVLVEGTDWEIVDGHTIRLIDAACDELLASSAPVVSAEFPCGVVVN
jgi:hypothetical protein